MKKIFTLILVLGFLGSAFAQNGYHKDDRSNNTYDQRNKETVYTNNHGGYDQRNAGYGNPSPWNGQDNRTDDKNRREMDRNNGGYDRRNSDYGADRQLPPYHDNNRNYPVVREQKQKTKTFTGGVVVGAVAGVLLGVLLSK